MSGRLAALMTGSSPTGGSAPRWSDWWGSWDMAWGVSFSGGPLDLTVGRCTFIGAA